MYNLMNGYNIGCLYLLPMLGRKQEDYPRFRDCFLGNGGETIVVLTRVGGGNRNQGYGEEVLLEDENFVKTWDDDFDKTYGYYEFKVPDKWKDDFKHLVANDRHKVSDAYVECVEKFFPKLYASGAIMKIFRGTETEK